MSYTVNGVSISKNDKAERINSITEIMFAAFPKDACTDVGIVLGAGIATPFAIREAAQLLKNDQVDHLIVCGGAVIRDIPETAFFKPHILPLIISQGLPLPQTGETESAYMVRYLESQGIARDQYTDEPKSTNTGETFQNLAKIPAYINAKSVNLIGLLPTRALMTMRWEEGKAQLSAKKKGWVSSNVKAKLSLKIATLTNISPLTNVTKDNWFENQIASFLVLAEFAKIDKTKDSYTNRHCVEIDLKGEITSANTLLRRLPEALYGRGLDLWNRFTTPRP